ncbi:surface protease GP63 [Trypanosoma theileri]|uniref:Leishmanolysin-like peptidase n=1 Tax=Trypanosoma theileri TaxID=67003 RepID=A0A1X0NZ76_9TRYP|nr:surface protease GP63 [Trypanosoma theileri]ORC89997.1 surface protease GP63 [Trypanosoma theileri]
MHHLLFAALLLLCCAYGCIAKTQYGTPYPPDPDEDPMPETEDSRVWGVKVARVLPRDDESNEEWQNIRIAMNPGMIQDALLYCKYGNQYTKIYDRFDPNVCEAVKGKDYQIRSLLLDVMRKAMEMHVERLKVKPVKGNLRIDVPFEPRPRRDTDGTMCVEVVPPFDGKDGMGIPNTDFVIYLGFSTKKPGTKICTYDKNGRPTSAIIKLDPREIADTREYVRVVAHEIAHGLGFTLAMREFQKMKRSVNNSGYVGYEELTSDEIERVRSLYKCGGSGMKLDSSVLRGERDLDAHFDGDVAREELMAPAYKDQRGAMKYTAFTLAVFESTEHYKAIYKNAERIRSRKTCPLRE